MSEGRLTRRQALLGAAAAGLGLTGCGSSAAVAAPSGSTLESTWDDPAGDGQLRVLAGEPFVLRDELGGRAALGPSLGVLAHLTDAHVLDASSPARVTFLNRLGPPFQSTFRPQEALTAHVLAGAVRAVRALRPDLVIQGGDLIDNDQSNELGWALGVLGGGLVRPGSGRFGYYGVQVASDPDPFYYRPDVDAPRHPGLLGEAVRPFRSAGLARAMRWVPVLGDHDVLVAGEMVPDGLTAGLAVGDRALWDLPSRLTLPPGLRAAAGLEAGAGGSPDGPPIAGLADQFLRRALAGPTVRVPPDPTRREMEVREVVGRLRVAAGGGLGSVDQLDYVVDVGKRLRVVVLDLASRFGGSGGVVVPGQASFVAGALAGAGERWVLFVSHQPLDDSVGGSEVQAVLDDAERVIATLAGHTHRNRVLPRATRAGGYWQIQTASLIDYPQQARALRVLETAGGGVAIQTWMLDHVSAGSLGSISRELSYLDAQGGRPAGFAGENGDRNVVLYRRAVAQA